MTEAEYKLSWDLYQKNICSGLGLLQQNEEFVDMTLAADGHFVKVHQMVLSMVSPYFKELIKSAQGQRPIIFLNNISYSTLCSMLEYIYSGEVLVKEEALSELIEAGKALHIKGLENMSITNSSSESQLSNSVQSAQPVSLSQLLLSSLNPTSYDKNNVNNGTQPVTMSSEHETLDVYDDSHNRSDSEGNKYDLTPATQRFGNTRDDVNISISPKNINIKEKKNEDNPSVLFTISNQGNLQLVLNRYVYNLRYSSKKTALGIRRQWKCINYSKCTSSKCQATVITQDSMVIKRIAAHTHPFHDKQIMKKMAKGTIFSAISEAEEHGVSLKESRKNYTDDE